MVRPFLTARWQDLALISYALEPAFLAPRLPKGCVPDLIGGQARCSLVAFDFRDARVFGRHWPWHVNFPEVNLRVYACRDGVRGVSFVSEFVPRRAIAWVARGIYNEPYRALPVTSKVDKQGDAVRLEHRLRVRGRAQRITVTATGPAAVPGDDGESTWIKEQHWGFGQTRRGQPLSYRVDHAPWAVYADAAADLDFDFAHVYGDDWAFLNRATPTSVVLAAGSTVSVSPRVLAAGAA